MCATVLARGQTEPGHGEYRAHKPVIHTHPSTVPHVTQQAHWLCVAIRFQQCTGTPDNVFLESRTVDSHQYSLAST